MTVYGNAPQDFGAKGYAACLENIHRECHKLMAMIGETADNYDRRCALGALEGIQDSLRVVETFCERREAKKRLKGKGGG